MTAGGVIPAPQERGVHVAGDLYDTSGRRIRVSVNGDTVVITADGATLDLRQCQTLAYLLIGAAWEAGRNNPIGNQGDRTA